MPDKPEPDEIDEAGLEEAIAEVTEELVAQADAAMAEEAPYDEAPPKLPTHKDDLVFLAIERGVPSYEAWAMTVPELTARLES